MGIVLQAYNIILYANICYIYCYKNMIIYRPVFLGPKSSRRPRTRQRWILCKPTEARCSVRALQSIADPYQLLSGGNYRLRRPPNTTTARLSLARWSRRSCRRRIIVYYMVVYRVNVSFFFSYNFDRSCVISVNFCLSKKKIKNKSLMYLPV